MLSLSFGSAETIMTINHFAEPMRKIFRIEESKTN